MANILLRPDIIRSVFASQRNSSPMYSIEITQYDFGGLISNSGDDSVRNEDVRGSNIAVDIA
jgi:hypothetical protein